jgi:hypothetical protein
VGKRLKASADALLVAVIATDDRAVACSPRLYLVIASAAKQSISPAV